MELSGGTLPAMAEETAETIQVPPRRRRSSSRAARRSWTSARRSSTPPATSRARRTSRSTSLGADASETLDSDRPVVVYCRGGNRSAAAAEALRNSGYDAHSIDGGLVAWDEAGLPLEPEGAEVAPAQNLPPR